MSWFKRLLPSKIRTTSSSRKSVPEGLWTKCQRCEVVLYSAELQRNLYVCPKCHHHHSMPARERLKLFLDNNEGAYHQLELGADILSVDKLKFKDSRKYKERLTQAIEVSTENEALIVIDGYLKTIPVIACAFEFAFMAGSMSGAVGERFVTGINAALEKRAGFICFAASGGARMQEGLISLMQMAKTSAALAKFSEAGLPFISVLTNPTFGGVSASLAMLGDIIVAEPQALIGFAGARVIAQTVRTPLPEGFQRSEFLLEHGAIDMIVDRRQMRDTLASELAKLMNR